MISEVMPTIPFAADGSIAKTGCQPFSSSFQSSGILKVPLVNDDLTL